jgi:hypothetical protein
LRDGDFVELFTEEAGYVNQVQASLLDDPGAPVDTVTVTDAPILALVTDGLANDIRTSAGVRGWLAAQWSRPTTSFATGDALRYRRQGSHDDRTAVVLWTVSAAGAVPRSGDAG